MKALAVLALVVVPLVAVGAPPPVAAASQKLEAARANLSKAVQAIDKDPPSQPDLDAALAAVGALKEAIDSGAELEASDLDFAKAVLAARKELRTQREYVDTRRANVDVHNSRRALDTALANVNDRASKAVEGKDAIPKDFDDARAAIEALRKSAEEARPLTKKDPKFATYLAEIDATVARQTKALDDRLTLQSADKSRGLLEEARKALTAAMAPVDKNATDPQFDTADKALAAVTKLLDDAKALEPKDKAYRADAEAARKEVAQAKKKMEAALSETGLARLKAEIDPAHKDLVAAARAVRAKKPSADALAEARTAAIVVRKLIEKFQGQASRSPVLGQYVDGVKGTLVEVEGILEVRSLDAARSDVAQAMKNVTGKAPTDEHFQEAASAVGILEKTLETVHAKEPAMVQPVADAKAAIKDAKATIAARQNELDVLGQKSKIDQARKDLAQAMKAVSGKAPTAEHFDEANTAAGILEKTLQTVKPKDPAIAPLVVDARALIKDARATIAARRNELDVLAQKATVEAARKDLAQAMKGVTGKAPTPEHFEEARTAVGILEKTVDGMKSKDPVLVPLLTEGRALVKDARATLAARRIEVDVQEQKAKVEEARKKAAEVMKPDIGTERLAEAEGAIKQIQLALDEGVALTKKDREYAAYDHEVRARVKELNDRLANRRIVLASSGGRGVLNEAIAAAKAKVDAAKQPEATDADLAAAAKALEAVTKELDARAELEKQDKAYATQAAKTRDLFMRHTETLEFAKQARELRRQTVEALALGVTTADGATGAKTLRSQKDQYDKALAQFKACDGTGGSLIKDNRPLETFPLFVDGRRTVAKDVIALCVQRAEATEKLLAQLKPLIAFDEGPKKSFEAGKGLLSQSKPADALKQFDECISSGSILQQRNPELKERKFDVAGESMTLPELIQQCVAQRKTLKAKK